MPGRQWKVSGRQVIAGGMVELKVNVEELHWEREATISEGTTETTGKGQLQIGYCPPFNFCLYEKLVTLNSTA